MNERMTELAEQARVQDRGYFIYQYGGPTGHQSVEKAIDLEKFAELIVRDTLDQVAEFNRLTKAYQTQGIDPEIDVTKEVLRNYGFTRFPRS